MPIEPPIVPRHAADRPSPTIPGAPAAGRPGSAELAEALSRAAGRLGFARVGFSSPEPFERGRSALGRWLARGFHGDLAYLARGPDRADPAALLDGVQTVMAVAMATPGNELTPLRAGSDGATLLGTVARYAVGSDYHDVMRRKLDELAHVAGELMGHPVRARACVDGMPLLEREAAERAGLGFIAKSTMLIVPGVGSYVLLGVLLLDVVVRSAWPSAGGSGCGGCRACLDACPTRAFVGPYEIDARRCISYLTIENRGPIPRELREAVGTRVFGCDVCQEVCPFNASGRPRPIVESLRPREAMPVLELGTLLLQGSKAHRRLVRGTALRRTSRNALARNAAVALGNSGHPRAVGHLERALRSHVSPLVRSHAAWALGRLAAVLEGPPADAALAALRSAAAADSSAEVRCECAEALAG